MDRRKYLAMVGIVAGTTLAGCSGETGGNNSSGGNGSGGGDGGDTEASGGDAAATEADDGGEGTAVAEGGDESTEAEAETEAGGGSDDEGDTEAEAETEAETSGGGDGGDGESGGVSLDEQDIVDGVTLDSSEWYNEDFSTGIRGELTAEQDFDYLFINAQIYDSDGTRIGEGSDSSSDIPSGETLTFDCILALDDPDAAASYNLEITPNA